MFYTFLSDYEERNNQHQLPKYYLSEHRLFGQVRKYNDWKKRRKFGCQGKKTVVTMRSLSTSEGFNVWQRHGLPKAE